jgi:hypothetical protein
MLPTGFKVTRTGTVDDLTTLITQYFAPIESGTPSGSVIAYLGESDIPGWVLCDGIPRPNTNLMYSKVANLRIGELLDGLFRPPNLTDKFLGGRLISKIDTDITPFDGSNTATLGTTNLPTHSHTGNTNSTSTDHNHISYARVINFNINEGNGGGTDSDGGGSGQGANRYDQTYTTEQLTSKMNNNSTHLHSFTTNNTGSGTAFSIVPFHYRVNYLLKL